MRGLVFLGLLGAAVLAGSPRLQVGKVKIGRMAARAGVLRRGECDAYECGTAAAEAGISCGEALAAGEIALIEDIECGADIFHGIALIRSGACDTCVDEIQDSIKKFLHNHPTPTSAYPSATGQYSAGYEYQYAYETGAFSDPGYSDDSPPDGGDSGDGGDGGDGGDSGDGGDGGDGGGGDGGGGGGGGGGGCDYRRWLPGNLQRRECEEEED